MILCAYTQSVFSGREIEALTKDSIRMMWLTQSQQPSYRTINRFRVNPLVNALLRDCFFIDQLVKEQLVDEEAIFINGTKIEHADDEMTRKSIRSKRKVPNKLREIFWTSKSENSLIKNRDRFQDNETVTLERFQSSMSEHHSSRMLCIIKNRRKSFKKILVYLNYSIISAIPFYLTVIYI